MFTCHKIGLGIALIAAAAPSLAATFEDTPGSPAVIPTESTRRFLDQVRDYGNGQPSPNVLYSTRKIGEATNSPGGRTITEGPSFLSIAAPPAHTPPRGSTLPGGKIEPLRLTPYSIQSPWK